MTPLEAALAARPEPFKARPQEPLSLFWRGVLTLPTQGSAGREAACARLAQRLKESPCPWDQELAGANALQLACLADEPSLIRALIASGAPASAFNHSGVSALASAIELGREACARALIEAGACLDPIRSETASGLPAEASEALRRQGLLELSTQARLTLLSARSREALEAAASSSRAQTRRRGL